MTHKTEQAPEKPKYDRRVFSWFGKKLLSLAQKEKVSAPLLNEFDVMIGEGPKETGSQSEDDEWRSGRFGEFGALYDQMFVGDSNSFAPEVDPKLAEQYAHGIVERMPAVIAHTDFSSLNWINKYTMSDKDFASKLAANLGQFPFPDHLHDFFRRMYKEAFEANIAEDRFLTPEIVNAIAKYPTQNGQLDRIVCLLQPETATKLIEAGADAGARFDFSSMDRWSEETIRMVNNRAEDLIRTTDDLYAMRECLDDKTLANRCIDADPRRAADSLSYEIHINDNKGAGGEFKDFFAALVDDIRRGENAKMSDIEANIRGGAYSRVFFIGEKVLKVGIPDKGRATPNFPDNPYIIRPLLRQSVRLDGREYFFEVTERVDTGPDICTEEELYDLYRKVRDLGLIWTDTKVENVGRLRRDNEIHWPEAINPSTKTLWLRPPVGNGTVLRKGDLVILDADFIAKEGDPTDEIPFVMRKAGLLRNKFEKRYQEEQSRKTESDIPA